MLKTPLDRGEDPSYASPLACKLPNPLHAHILVTPLLHAADEQFPTYLDDTKCTHMLLQSVERFVLQLVHH